ncbi:hypothetical protein DAI22_10g133501 [Oryza sativa Japonica Group]|nr:hypothetical protein DAI22_10g133501 [Oryza sativa Japonica Group]
MKNGMDPCCTSTCRSDIWMDGIHLCYLLKTHHQQLAAGRGKGKMKICPFQKARVEAESWARCCTGSQAHTLLALASTSGDLEAPM